MNIHISGEMLFIGWLIILITLIWIGNNISKLPIRYENSYVQNISNKVNDIEACLCHLFGVEDATEISFLELNAEEEPYMDLKTLYDFAERYEQHLEEIVSLLKQNGRVA